MIKAIITDVDGVIVGTKKGINFPYPSPEIIQALSKIRQSGIPVILCTAKATYANTEIILRAHLNNAHITNGGATIIDPLDKKVLAKHVISPDIIYQLTKGALEKNILVELHTEDNFLVQKSQLNYLVEKHAEIMQKQPIVVENLLDEVNKNDIIKFFMIPQSEKEMPIVEEVLTPVKDKITFIQTHHPTMLPAQIAAITSLGVSKRHASEEIIKNLGFSFADVLGIGDTLGDWKYMELCGYVGTTGNDNKLQALAKTKGEGNYFIGKSADDDGALDILTFFKLA